MYYVAFSLQMLPLNASVPLRSIYLSDFPCLRTLGIFLFLGNLQAEEFTVHLFLQLAVAI